MFQVLRRNPEFRKLWLAQVVSQSGDWLNKTAGLAVIARLGGAEEAALGLGLLYATENALRLLPAAILGPFAGPVADRVPRKLLLVAGDLVRAALVLCYLFVDEPSELPLLYALLFGQMGLGIFFDAARQGALPNTVRQGDLHAAIALSAGTWSAMLSVGALLGGLLVLYFGTDTAFVADSSTYVVSASLYAATALPRGPAEPGAFRWRDVLFGRDLVLGWRHARDRGIRPILVTKLFWGPAGGLLVLLSVAAYTRFAKDDVGADVAPFAFGLLYAARGVGTAIGPFVARRVVGTTPLALVRTIGLGFAVAAVAYALFGLASSLYVAALCVTVAHVGGGAIWVASTSFWQHSVDDRFRGRTHALDFLGMTTSFATYGLLAGLLYDGGLDLGATTFVLAGCIAVSGSVWWIVAARLRRRSADRTCFGSERAA
ncbi:MAG: MFS transporter [Planctomycetota bacterium]